MLEVLKWTLSYIVSVALMLHPLTMPIAAGLATMPVLMGIGDPHARIVLSMAMFMAFLFLAMNFAELAALAVCIEVRKCLTKIHIWAAVSAAERRARKKGVSLPEYFRVEPLGV
jgi:hypothetical protein